MPAADLVRAFAKAVDAKDADALGRLFTEDAVFVNILGMRMLGRQGIVDGHRWAFDGPLRHSTVAVDAVTEVTAGTDVSVAHATLQRGRADGASPEGLPEGATVLVLTAHRDGGNWLAVSAANVAVAAPPA